MKMQSMPGVDAIVAGIIYGKFGLKLLPKALMNSAPVTAGMDMVQFGAWFCIMITIGLITPPVGMTLFVTSSITKVPLIEISKQLLPFIVIVFAVTDKSVPTSKGMSAFLVTAIPRA